MASDIQWRLVVSVIAGLLNSSSAYRSIQVGEDGCGKGEETEQALRREKATPNRYILPLNKSLPVSSCLSCVISSIRHALSTDVSGGEKFQMKHTRTLCVVQAIACQ